MTTPKWGKGTHPEVVRHPDEGVGGESTPSGGVMWSIADLPLPSGYVPPIDRFA